VKTPEDDKPSDTVKAAETTKTSDPAKAADAVDPPRLTVAALRAYATALPDQRLSKIMLTAIDGAKGDVDVVRKNLEGWFDSTMDRVSGWYKRRTQKYLFWIGILSAVFLNVDSITIAQRLTNDKTLREAIVATAKTQSTTPASGENKTYDQLATEVRSIGYPIGWKGLYPQPQMCQAVVAPPTKPAAKPGDSAAAKPAEGSAAKPGEAVAAKPADASATKAADPSAKKPDGYGQLFYETLFEAPGCTFDLWALPRTIAGWFVTAFAIMLGAPFWFDVLNKFMVVRSTIKPSERVRTKRRRTIRRS
jgi:hypothetical protein